MFSRVLLVALLLTATPEPRVSIRVNASVISAGGSIHVKCLVPHNTHNRVLVVGISPYAESQRQLDGDQAPYAWDFEFDHLPCGAYRALCAVVSTDADPVYAMQPIHVVGCGE